MNRRHVYVISDLHIGGNPALPVAENEPPVSFCMFDARSSERLTRFLEYLCATHGDAPEDCELVINGDIVDFLAEERMAASPDEAIVPPRFDAFVADPRTAARKLERIVARNRGVFAALSAFVRAGHALTLLLGNHDIELTLPEPRHLLLETLGRGAAGRVEFLHDGEAYRRNGILIEHGNRYDGWNAVDHGALRALRARSSRGEPPWPVDPPPGSRLVTEVMNGLKTQLRFIDLLKPENEALIPLLRLLKPDAFSDMQNIAHLALRYTSAVRTEPAAGAVPVRESYTAGSRGLSATAQADAEPDRDDPAGVERTLAALKFGEGDAPYVPASSSLTAGGIWHAYRSAAGFARLWTSRRDEQADLTDDDLRALRRTLTFYSDQICAAYDFSHEEPRYLKAARRLATCEPVVIFGHTHLPKYLRLDDVTPGARYINTGTWCPIIELPTAIADARVAEADAINILRSFVAALRGGGGPQPLNATYAHVQLEDGRPWRSDLMAFGADGQPCCLTPPSRQEAP